MPTLSDLQRHSLPENASLKEALARLNSLSGENMTLFCVSGSGKLIGSLTDGDIRRALTSGVSLDAPASEACNRRCLRVSSAESRYSVALEAKRKGISLIPVVEEERLSSIIDLRFYSALLPLDAVMMAGGRGERLRPLTDSCPKPLLKVGGRPIIDYNVEALMRAGVENIFVTVNYMREMIQEHFSSPLVIGGKPVSVKCVAEPCRLGTMGSLSLVEGLREENLLVMNSDLLTDIDFAAMYARHISSGAALTMAVIPYSVNVPFAVVEHESDRVTALAEKPTYNYLANAGIYMMRRDVAERIPKGEYLDAPDLIDSLIAGGQKVAWFRIDGIWVDIGSPADFQRADDMLSLPLNNKL